MWWDSNSQVTNTTCIGEASTTTSAGLVATLGLDPNTITTSWGREVLVDNSSASTRNPNTTGVAVPYTARLLAEVPWGDPITVTVNGLY